LPSRGSGIGAGFGSGLTVNTSTRSAAPGQVYGPQVATGIGSAGVHHYLWILVLLELAALVALRRAFRNHHGG